MISSSWELNLLGGALLALIATAAMIEAKSSSLVPKSLLLWPALVIIYGALNLALGLQEFLFRGLLGLLLILAGIQAGMVNVRRLSSWPSGLIWLALVAVGMGMQTAPLLMQRLMGYVWIAVAITKVVRQRSASLEAGTPSWILLLYVQAVLLASHRS